MKIISQTKFQPQTWTEKEIEEKLSKGKITLEFDVSENYKIKKSYSDVDTLILSFLLEILKIWKKAFLKKLEFRINLRIEKDYIPTLIIYKLQYYIQNLNIDIKPNIYIYSHKKYNLENLIECFKSISKNICFIQIQQEETSKPYMKVLFKITNCNRAMTLYYHLDVQSIWFKFGWCCCPIGYTLKPNIFNYRFFFDYLIYCCADLVKCTNIAIIPQDVIENKERIILNTIKNKNVVESKNLLESNVIFLNQNNTDYFKC